MFNTKFTLPLAVIAGMTAGSTVAFAQTVNNEVGGRGDGSEIVVPGTSAADASANPLVEDEGGRTDGTEVTEDAAATADMAPLGDAVTDPMVGMSVYGPEGEEVGVVSRLSPADAAGDERVLIGTTGGRSVEIPVSDLMVETDAQGAIVRISTAYTAADIDNLPQVEM